MLHRARRLQGVPGARCAARERREERGRPAHVLAGAPAEGCFSLFVSIGQIGQANNERPELHP